MEHTAEIELEIEASSEEAVFEDAVRALGELLGDAGGEPVSYELVIAAEERALLLAEWLDELVYCAETSDLVPEEVERIELGRSGLTATVRGRRGSPPHLVKGVTHHRLAFERSDRGFRATLVLDV